MTVAVPDDIEAVVYDLDGTLVRLTVDWQSVEADIAGALREEGIDPVGLDAWAMLDAGEGVGVGSEVESLIAAAERDGADESVRLAFADEVETRLPIGVCSLNCEAACRIALEKHDLAERMESVVGRDSVAGRKPAPEPLLAAVKELGATPGRTLFVGDSAGDEEAAERAGTQFSYVGDGPTSY
jgi:phosphoglycolate phosphatase-like HAD superfamily hydrolase